ncbi:tetratricopeptide repeat protein [Methanobrevibacter sp.]|uniref:tetratricopeptide repeat protein n=1 Tax=Methanobrevibacter sp. TaxID=66852 RepID=UPI003D7C3A30
MNFRFNECKKEFDGGNFDKALAILNEIEIDDEDYTFALMLKYNCLMGLGCYDDALDIINLLISNNPYFLLLWFDKVRCLYFLDDLTGAVDALKHVERLVDLNDVDGLVCFVKLCNLVGEHETALKYCDMVLDIDEYNVDVLLEKSLVSNIFNDKNMMSECGDKLLDVCESNMSILMVCFALKLFSGMYRDCFDVILNISSMDFKMGETLKKIFYNQMLCDFNVQVLVENSAEITIDESISLLFDYRYDGIDFGNVKNVKYIILAKT